MLLRSIIKAFDTFSKEIGICHIALSQIPTTFMHLSGGMSVGIGCVSRVIAYAPAHIQTTIKNTWCAIQHSLLMRKVH